MKNINKAKTVNFRITETLYGASRKAAAFKKISWSLFVRDAIREKIEKVNEEWYGEDNQQRLRREWDEGSL